MYLSLSVAIYHKIHRSRSNGRMLLKYYIKNKFIVSYGKVAHGHKLSNKEVKLLDK